MTIFDLQTVPKPVADKGMRLLVVYQKARRRRRFGSAAGQFMAKRRTAFYRQAWEDAARDTGATLTHLDPVDVSSATIFASSRRINPAGAAFPLRLLQSSPVFEYAPAVPR